MIGNLDFDADIVDYFGTFVLYFVVDIDLDLEYSIDMFDFVDIVDFDLKYLIDMFGFDFELEYSIDMFDFVDIALRYLIDMFGFVDIGCVYFDSFVRHCEGWDCYYGFVVGYLCFDW